MLNVDIQKFFMSVLIMIKLINIDIKYNNDFSSNGFCYRIRSTNRRNLSNSILTTIITIVLYRYIMII